MRSLISVLCFLGAVTNSGLFSAVIPPKTQSQEAQSDLLASITDEEKSGSVDSVNFRAIEALTAKFRRNRSFALKNVTAGNGKPYSIEATAALRILASYCLGPYPLNEGRNWVQVSWICDISPSSKAISLTGNEQTGEIIAKFAFVGSRVAQFGYHPRILLPARGYVPASGYKDIIEICRKSEKEIAEQLKHLAIVCRPFALAKVSKQTE